MNDLATKKIDPTKKIGAVSYLNTKPLVYGLPEWAPGYEVVYEPPSRLADGLAEGVYDVALIPTIEFLHQPNYTLVSDACIACRGPVLSVKLFSRTPINQIRRLALDAGSRTSIALCRILLAERHGFWPETINLPLETRVEDLDADAILLIGDRAMHAPAGEFAEVWDLGEQWRNWTGLPFVFAMWTAPPQNKTPELEQALRAARDAGISHLAEIAAAEAAGVGLAVDACHRYLRDNLHFTFGQQERAGFAKFSRCAAELGLAPKDGHLRIDDCKIAG